MKKVLIIIALIIVAGAIQIFLSGPQETFNDRPVIATTIFPVYDITKNIAGDEFDIVLILPVGANPHTFEPTPSIVREVQNAKVFFKIGYGIDDWVDGLASQANTNRSIDTGEAETTIQRLSDGIVLRTADGAIDPHYWLSIPNAKIMAKNITATLTETYPEFTSDFQSNLESYLRELEIVDIYSHAQSDFIANKNIVTMHDAWYYFADEYSLNIVGTFEPASGKEPTPQYLANLLLAVQASGVPTIYSEPQSSEVAFMSFAKDNSLKIAELDDIGGVPGRMSYIDLIKYNVQTFVQNQ